jgi:hypothetical protein
MSDAGALRATLVSAACFLRSLPLFFGSAPRTPLRVLGIVAFDTLHVIRRSHWLPRDRVGHLVMFFDFAGLTNAALDHKALCDAEYSRLRDQLKGAGLGGTIDDYLVRLRTLEHERPLAGGDRRRFEDVRAYREAVARLSLAVAADIALTPSCADDGSGVTHDGDLEILLRILMQCQVIDDVLDYQVDAAAGLPSFLTACASVSEAMALTADAARRYASPPALDSVLPLRVTLRVVTVLTALVVTVVRPRPRNARQFAR